MEAHSLASALEADPDDGTLHAFACLSLLTFRSTRVLRSQGVTFYSSCAGSLPARFQTAEKLNDIIKTSSTKHLLLILSRSCLGHQGCDCGIVLIIPASEVVRVCDGMPHGWVIVLPMRHSVLKPLQVETDTGEPAPADARGGALMHLLQQPAGQAGQDRAADGEDVEFLNSEDEDAYTRHNVERLETGEMPEVRLFFALPLQQQSTLA